MTRAALIRTDRYSHVAILFHWTIAALVIFNIVVGIFHESLLEGLPVMPAHKALGMLVLVLTVGRIGWRLANPAPAHPASMAAWERTVAGATHLFFYFLLLAMPLTGWMMGGGKSPPRSVDIFGLFQVPGLPVGKPIAGAAHEFHELAGYLFAALVVLHIAAALRHHFMLKDGVLARMVPGLGR